MNFTESQYFRQWWLHAVLIFPPVVVISLMFANDGSIKGDEINALVLFLSFEALIFLLMWFSHLKTEINKEGITFKFFPYINRQRVFRWEDIQRAYIRKYRPIGEYGGWGLKLSFKAGKAYNVSGNMGLQLVLKNGKKILIGTQREKEMEAFLRQLKRKHEIAPIEEQ